MTHNKCITHARIGREQSGMFRRMMSAFWSGGQHARRRPRHRHVSQSINRKQNHMEGKSQTMARPP